MEVCEEKQRMNDLNMLEEAMIDQLKGENETIYASRNEDQKDVWGVEDVERIRETYEIIKPIFDRRIVIEFLNNIVPMVKTEEQNSDNLAIPEPF
jgi:hypothetical protein